MSKLILLPAKVTEAVFTNIGPEVKGVVSLENDQKIILTIPADKAKFYGIGDNTKLIKP